MVIAYPPKDWMKVLACDPGTGRAGVVAGAVPPPLEGESPSELHIWADRMIYNADATAMAEVARELTGGYLFEAFIIDKKAAQQTPMGFGKKVYEQYEDKFREAGVISRTTGSGFVMASDDVIGRELLVKQMIRDGSLKVHRCCANLVRQMNEFYHKKDQPNKRMDRIALEMVHGLEYLVAFFNGRLYYHPPEPADTQKETNVPYEMYKLFERHGWRGRPDTRRGMTFGCPE